MIHYIQHLTHDPRDPLNWTFVSYIFSTNRWPYSQFCNPKRVPQHNSKRWISPTNRETYLNLVILSSLPVAVLERFYCWYVTLRCDLELWPRDLDLWSWTCSRPASPQSNPARNLSEIGQSAAELLRFEYLTLWPWTPITCSAMLCDSLHKV